jgi:hypothetical protein
MIYKKGRKDAPAKQWQAGRRKSQNHNLLGKAFEVLKN